MTHVRGRRVYLSGPMTGIENWNGPAFADGMRLLAGFGADTDHSYNPAAYVTEMHKWSHDRCLMASIRALCSRRPGPQHSIAAYDLLVSLPGWEQSAGARLEREVAEACGIEVCNLDEVTS